jgi:pimeloyl-ACP methyl ester carboxylesterase
VFLNTGSEPHVGPGRAWVEYARTLSAAGHTTLRVDFTGWGESPDEGHAPGRPYDAHTVDDTVDIVEQLTAQGYERIVLVGLCASAWVALKAVLLVRIAGVIAINPQLYWEPGDPVEATMAETRKRRTAEREREERGGRLGLWTALDALGFRPTAAKWLRAIARRRTPVLLLFAEGDDGLEFFHNRVRRSFRYLRRSGVVDVVEVPDIDHPMHRQWLRGNIVAAMTGFLGRLDSVAD